MTITSAVTPGYVWNVTTNANEAAAVQFPIDSSTTVGDYPNAIAASFAGDEAFGAADVQASVTLLGGTPPVTWSQPAAVTYGTALGTTQLNATSSFPGTFVYSPPAGTLLDGGTHTLSVTFTPTESAHWAARTVTMTIVVNKATPTVDISSAPLFYTGQPRQAIVTVHGVGGAELNPFTVSYNGGSTLPVNAGTYALQVTYGGSANYEAATATGSLVINKATPTMPTIGDITETYDGLAHGIGVNVAGVTGEWLTPVIVTYNGSATAPTNAGVYAIEARYDGSANYNAISRTATLTILKAAPYLTWTYPATITYGTPLSATQLNATSNVAGTFSYSPAAGTVLNAGARTLTATFTPTDAANYETASASRPLTVSKATAQVTWYAPAPIVYGTPLGPTQLNATANTSGAFVYTPAAGAVLNAGTTVVWVAFTPDDLANYNAPGNAGVPVTVTKATPIVTWNNPAGIVYGTALSNAQLNATVNVGGTFSYSPSAGAVLNAGAQTLSATFTPSDAANYSGATASVTIDVAKAASTITWANPADIVYGTALGASQLNATANVAGTVAYSPAAGTVLGAGSQTLSVTFTPTDSNNFTGASATATLNVAKAASTITWLTPTAIVYGTALAATQLNATATVAGTFAYAPAAGAVLNAGPQTLTVTFTPTDATNYSGSTASVTLNVTKAASTLTWSNPADIAYGTALGAAQLNATASVQGAFSYSPAAGAVLNAGPQTLSVTFTPTDATDYNGSTASVTLNVTKAGSTLAWPTPASIVYGTALSAAQLNATANVPGTFTYSPVAGTVLNAGSRPLSVTFTPADTANYTGSGASRSLTVTPAALTIRANDASKVFGAPLPAFSASSTGFVNGDSMSSLSGALSFSTPATASSAAGSYAITPSGVSSSNYAIAFANGTLTIARASTTTAVAASPNPDGLNQAVTLTAAVLVVAPGAGAPSGIVQFFDGSTLLGSATLAGGAASLTTNGFAAGSHTIAATYAGDGSFNTSSGSAGLTVKTSAASSTTAVTSSANPATVGQNVTLTATVTAPSGLSGSVAFYDGSSLIGTVALSGTTARLTTSALAAGGHAITARYLGNATIPPSTSSAFAQHVRPSGAQTRASTTALTASPSPATLGSTVTLTATVTGSQQRPPTGVVLFMLNGSVLGQGTVSQTGSVTAAVSFGASSLPHGTHKVEAVYLGDATFRASTNAISLVVN
ncbi:MAG TPA: Ig-like domain repeat protein [Vicinamibacterales bacterium]|nr:Ig-like domain repeat protein [Vicinamibacterales bacterium]